MIFIVLGTQKFQFNRLLKKIDTLIQNGKITEDVVAQIGHSDYKPVNFKYSYFLDNIEFNYLIEKCSLLITHSGVGTIITGLKKKKSIIVCPRLSKYGEHVDDHQIEIAEDFFKVGYVLPCFDIDKLENKIEQSYHFNFLDYHSKKNQIINTIRTFINKDEKF
ncbi:PssE/Cps14G family polysaccharide biosynthesis glycosyltransferase [Lactiplantibacillus plantarum]|uniref:PssE/Cps14G family polysaccharide biosynthesis glycosyltransferase n=1 Tax=Lactiplantibacillus plantarum TaxID=1590 RepID=UPI0023DF1795|nr:PssE/Cps14G family polysaccharide biosynthesis glycosyltransferase [Lactiplantibacillus plantarum]MDF3265840.1 PssE/Cps14G family polysaccharide biosynthesis glycosyltransferase [Lactiplantibacillus plantarum]